jgi:hypothetical protein
MRLSLCWIACVVAVDAFVSRTPSRAPFVTTTHDTTRLYAAAVNGKNASEVSHEQVAAYRDATGIASRRATSDEKSGFASLPKVRK